GSTTCTCGPSPPACTPSRPTWWSIPPSSAEATQSCATCKTRFPPASASTTSPCRSRRRRTAASSASGVDDEVALRLLAHALGGEVVAGDHAVLDAAHRGALGGEGDGDALGQDALDGELGLPYRLAQLFLVQTFGHVEGILQRAANGGGAVPLHGEDAEVPAVGRAPQARVVGAGAQGDHHIRLLQSFDHHRVEAQFADHALQEHGAYRVGTDAGRAEPGTEGLLALGEVGLLQGLALQLAVRPDGATLAAHRLVGQEAVDGLGGIRVDEEFVPAEELDHDVEGGGRASFVDRLGRAPPPRLLVAQGDGVHAADEVGEDRVHHQVFQAVAVGGGHELHAALGDGPGRGRLGLGSDLVDDDHLGHVVFDCLDHHRVLPLGVGHLHAPRRADAGVGDVPVAADLVGGVHDHHALARVVGEDAGALAELGRLAHARRAEQQDVAAALDQVADRLDRAEDGAPHAQGEADDPSLAVANGGDAVEGAFDAGAVVAGEGAQLPHDVVDVVLADDLGPQVRHAAGKARLGHAPQIHHDFDEVLVRDGPKLALEPLGQLLHEDAQVVGCGGRHGVRFLFL